MKKAALVERPKDLRVAMVDWRQLTSHETLDRSGIRKKRIDAIARKAGRVDRGGSAREGVQHGVCPTIRPVPENGNPLVGGRSPLDGGFPSIEASHIIHRS